MIKISTLFAGALTAAMALSQPARAADPDPRNWDAVLEEARARPSISTPGAARKTSTITSTGPAATLKDAPWRQGGSCEAR
jgi:hypothetical protein